MARQLRLDKFLCEAGLGTRSEVKVLLKKGLIHVNGQVIKTADLKVYPEADEICCQGQRLIYQEFYYYMMHKPAGVITATEDKSQPTVMELLGKVNRPDLFPVGRLDKDTEGLLLITNDGELAHALLSPRKHVPKTYLVRVPEKLNLTQIEALEKGVDIGDDKLTLPARVQVVDEEHVLLTICEGRFHQVKRMLAAVGSQVLYLKRMTFGTLVLDKDLQKGKSRPLSQEEIETLKQCVR